MPRPRTPISGLLSVLVIGLTMSVAVPPLAREAAAQTDETHEEASRDKTEPLLPEPEPDTVDEVIAAEVRENELSAGIQERIDEISEDTDAMAAQYRASLQNTRQLKVYNRQLEGLIEAQEAEMISLREQIDDVTVVGRGVMPHMQEMLATLERFIELDMPFLLEERRDRVANLNELMGRADVTISEKYRRILESYQIENDYGRTIEAYRGTIGDGGEEGDARTVDFLRIGRNALLYQTLDGQESGAWDGTVGRWQALDGYRIPIREGLRMARKQRAPDLIQVPLPAPEVLQ